MTRRDDLGPGGRVVAACLAGVWLVGGLWGVLLGVRIRPGVLPVLMGLLALGYGWLWARVAVTGQRQQWALWRRGPKHGAR